MHHDKNAAQDNVVGDVRTCQNRGGDGEQSERRGRQKPGHVDRFQELIEVQWFPNEITMRFFSNASHCVGIVYRISLYFLAALSTPEFFGRTKRHEILQQSINPLCAYVQCSCADVDDKRSTVESDSGQV